MSSSAFIIRPYEPRDRRAIRQIWCDTADAGRPVEAFLRDRDLVADLVTRYYTDFEPGSTWVAESAGEVIGYLTGCVDTRRSRRITRWRIGPLAILRAVARGALLQADTWHFLYAAWKTIWLGAQTNRKQLDSFPAHLHVNVHDGFRGLRVGERLVQRFFDQAKEAGCVGVHARVRGDNQSGCRFFERMGFSQCGRVPFVLPYRKGYLHTEAILYAIDL